MMSTKSSRMNYGRISSSVPQAGRTITIFLFLFTACHVACMEWTVTYVYAHVHTHTYTDNIHVRLRTVRRTSQPKVVLSVVSLDDIMLIELFIT